MVYVEACKLLRRFPSLLAAQDFAVVVMSPPDTFRGQDGLTFPLLCSHQTSVMLTPERHVIGTCRLPPQTNLICISTMYWIHDGFCARIIYFIASHPTSFWEYCINSMRLFCFAFMNSSIGIVH